MKFKDIANMSDADRKKTVSESKAELIKLNGQVATGTTPKSPGKIKQLKKTIAQVLTFENQQKKSTTESSKPAVDSPKKVTAEKK
jgi:large subunit ribosomal protein L29